MKRKMEAELMLYDAGPEWASDADSGSRVCTASASGAL